MNTKETLTTIAALAQADRTAVKAGEKSNLVLNFVRNNLIKAAFEVSTDVKKKTTMELSMTIASYIIPAITLLSKEGTYPALLKTAVITIKEGTVILDYIINAAGLSPEYREKLNETLSIALQV